MKIMNTSSCLAYGLALLIMGCSEATQFTTNSVPSTAGDMPSSTQEADATGETDELSGKATEVPETADNEAEAGKVANAALDPNAINSSANSGNSQTAVDQLQQLCSQGAKKTLTQRIRFPETTNCRFGQAGNLERKDAFLQAMEAQTTSIALPAKTQLCGVSVDSQVSTIQYDDFMVLTLNGYVLLSSNQQILQGLEGSASTAYKWDFTKIRGVGVDFDAAPYCMGGTAGLCEIPVTDTPGKFQFKVDPTSLINVADQVVNSRALNFALIATGDNDDLDCWHTELNLDFTLQYVDAP